MKKEHGHHNDHHHKEAHPNKHHEHMGGSEEHIGSHDGDKVMKEVAKSLTKGNAEAHTHQGKRGLDCKI